jgi:probable blue pigment (indigoidine) exporter
MRKIRPKTAMAVVSRSGRSPAHCSTIRSTPSLGMSHYLDVEHLDKEGSRAHLLGVEILYIEGCPVARIALCLVTAVTPAVWGTTYIATTELLPPGRPLLAAALRALPAGLLLVAVTRRLPRGQWWWRTAVLGTLNIGAFFALLFVSAYRLPGGVAAVLGAAQPLLVAGLSVALLAERVPRRTVLAGLAGVLGVGLTVLTDSARLDPIGVLAGLAGTTCMGFGVVLTKRWGRPVSLLTMTGWQLTAGGLLLLPTALLAEGLPATVSTENIAGYAYLSLVGGALAYALWFRGLERLPAASVSLLGLLSPLVAAVVGWAVLGQRLSPLQLVGMAVALGGVAAGQTAPPSRAAQDAGRSGRSRRRRRAAAEDSGSEHRRGPGAQLRSPQRTGPRRCRTTSRQSWSSRPHHRGLLLRQSDEVRATRSQPLWRSS